MATAVTFGRRLLIAMMVPALPLAMVTLRPAPARADTVISVINLPGVVIDNQCNGEPVGLSGELLTVVTTRPTPSGTPRCGRSRSPGEGLATVLQGTSQVPGSRSIRRRTAGPSGRSDHDV